MRERVLREKGTTIIRIMTMIITTIMDKKNKKRNNDDNKRQNNNKKNNHDKIIRIRGIATPTRRIISRRRR